MSARGLLVGLLVLGVAALGGFAWVRAEGDAPSVQAPETLALGAGGREVVIAVADRGSGLRSFRASLVHARGESPLAAQEYPGSLLRGGEPGGREASFSLHIDPAALGAPEGDAFLRVVARDWSWRELLSGNETQLDVPVRIDLHAPRVSVRSGLTYLRRGGAGTVEYGVGEPTARDGVSVGDAFFPGYPAPGGGRVAIFALPTDAPPDPPIRVLAEDEAGNVTTARWPVVVQERELPRASVSLPGSFLEDTVRGLARDQGIPTDDLAVAFQRVNEELRAANEARIRELVADSSPQRLWRGPFEQLRNSQVTSRFAERRTYLVDGRPLSQATHFGFDLAATQATPITAANAGRVAFAGELGIYGNCVLIDHGMGLASLYGHLSRLDVAAGENVDKGQPLGLSGATGLAGGDHLHFAILVGGYYVDPLEWWDAKWVQTHVEARLAPSSP